MLNSTCAGMQPPLASVRRLRCGGCDSRCVDLVLDLDTTPLADSYPATADEPETRYPLQLLVCDDCSLVQLGDVVPDELLYGADYGFYASSSPALSVYHTQYALWLAQRYAAQIKDRYVVEIACNDGLLLKQLAMQGANAVGVDPAPGPVTAARARGLSVYNVAFDRDFATKFRAAYGPVGLVVANNVLAHVADLRDIVSGIAHLLADDGVAVVEFQYLLDLLAGNQWDHVYHEHRFYFSLTALAPVLAAHGLTIVHVLHHGMQGGSLRLTLARSGTPAQLPSEDELPGLLAGFQSRVDYCADRLTQMVNDVPGTVAVYGATAKSTTLLNYACLTSADLTHVVDTTPHKIGRFTPGTGIPIVAPGTRPEPTVYLLAAWNYLGSVLSIEQPFIDRGGRFLVPVPTPVLL